MQLGALFFIVKVWEKLTLKRTIKGTAEFCSTKEKVPLYRCASMVKITNF